MGSSIPTSTPSVNPATTFYCRVSGSSMESVGVFDGDLLIVDRVGYTPWSGCVRMVILAGADPRLSGTAQVQWGTRNVTQVSIPEPGTGRSTDLPRHGAARLEESVSEIARKVRQSVHSCRERTGNRMHARIYSHIASGADICCQVFGVARFRGYYGFDQGQDGIRPKRSRPYESPSGSMRTADRIASSTVIFRRPWSQVLSDTVRPVWRPMSKVKQSGKAPCRQKIRATIRPA